MTAAPYRKEVMKKKEGMGDEIITVKGIVIPVDWDEEGNPIATAILAPGEEEYFVEQEGEGIELLGLMQHEVEATGMLRETVRGHKVITVKSYEVKKGGNQWGVS